MEAVLVRLATEYKLSEGDTANIGKFRQAYQSLRKVIRQDEQLNWHSSEHPEYLAFKRLACSVANLLSNQVAAGSPDPEESAAALRAITDNGWEKAWAK